MFSRFPALASDLVDNATGKMVLRDHGPLFCCSLIVWFAQASTNEIVQMVNLLELLKRAAQQEGNGNGSWYRSAHTISELARRFLALYSLIYNYCL